MCDDKGISDLQSASLRIDQRLLNNKRDGLVSMMEEKS